MSNTKLDVKLEPLLESDLPAAVSRALDTELTRGASQRSKDGEGELGHPGKVEISTLELLESSQLPRGFDENLEPALASSMLARR